MKSRSFTSWSSRFCMLSITHFRDLWGWIQNEVVTTKLVDLTSKILRKSWWPNLRSVLNEPRKSSLWVPALAPHFAGKSNVKPTKSVLHGPLYDCPTLRERTVHHNGMTADDGKDVYHSAHEGRHTASIKSKHGHGRPGKRTFTYGTGELDAYTYHWDLPSTGHIRY